jgi:endonuclease YncB( thermonuclease family)
MIKYLIILLFFVTSAHAEPTEKHGVIYDVQVLRVIDGDTVVIAAPYLPDPLKKELSIRVYGIDTPEKGFRAKCAEENTEGLTATEFTKQKVSSATKIQIELLDWDKFGGRVLGNVIIDGVSLRQDLINAKLAREYYGEAKQSWCEIK